MPRPGDWRYLLFALQQAPAAPSLVFGPNTPVPIHGTPYLPGLPGGGGIGWQLQFLYEPDYIMLMPGLVTVSGVTGYQNQNWGVRLYDERVQALQGAASPGQGAASTYTVTTPPVISFPMTSFYFEFPWTARSRYIFVELVNTASAIPAANSWVELGVGAGWRD